MAKATKKKASKARKSNRSAKSGSARARTFAALAKRPKMSAVELRKVTGTAGGCTAWILGAEVKDGRIRRLPAQAEDRQVGESFRFELTAAGKKAIDKGTVDHRNVINPRTGTGWTEARRAAHNGTAKKVVKKAAKKKGK